MKFIDTFWERENLGVESGKFIVDSDEDIQKLKEMLDSCGKEYVEVDVAPGCMKVLSLIEEKGFHFIETAIELKGSVTDIRIPKAMSRFVDKVSYSISTDDDMRIIRDVISSGEMFLTDKISLNSAFGPQKAGKRYNNWVKELLDGDARCFSIYYMDRLIGFEVSIIEDGIVELLLGGGFPEGGVGTGMITVTASYDYWMHQNIKSIKTRVSSNNVSVLKLHELFGLKVDAFRYIFVRKVERS